MSNVHGLFSGKKKDDDDSEDESNNRYVGGIGEHGGGSGLAVLPNNDSERGGGGDRDAVFGLAQSAAPDERSQIRRTITMYRDGFQVDDGPYRRLDDPANADFLKALAQGRTPAEMLQTEGGAPDGNVVVGLIDKRSVDYEEEEPTFQSFSGQGHVLAAAAGAATDGMFDPTTLPEQPPTVDESHPTTTIAVRTLSSGRRVIRINLSATVRDLAAHVRQDAEAGAGFYLAAGFPPKPLTDPNQTIEAAGLKGAQVSMKK